jgi:aspartyl-tRNA(Asn)/glutamyl-tRNA(Gln) amidotransferase subunit B
MQFETVIGLEVHAQLKTKSKIFCGCSTAFGAPPNTHTCPVCLGMPGVLPVLNKKVVEYAVRCGIATHCTINRESRFDRKNYFYPDLPKGYQISQYELPIAEHGHLDIELEDNTKKRIGITRIHMEEDAGKSTHDPERPLSMVDLNRTGVPLIEIVSEPDLRSIVRYIDICDGNMEEGSFRCDANISLRPKGTTVFGTRTELKNLNSFRHVEKALHYEINRQTALLENGTPIVQETRLWDTTRNRTISMRGKEEAHDYRYFPEPDLLPVIVEETWINDIRQNLPELPDQKKERFIHQYNLSANDADVLIANRTLAEYFEAAAAGLENIKQACNWVIGPLLGFLHAENKTIEDTPVSAEGLNALLQLMEKDVISAKSAKTVFEEMARSQKDAETIVKEKGLVQVTDQSAIEETIAEILTNNPKEVEAYQNGKTKLFSFFVGQVMRATKGKANPKIVNSILKQKLDV